MFADSGTRSRPWSVLSSVLVGFLWLCDRKAATPACYVVTRMAFTVEWAGNGYISVLGIKHL
ncbi:hypothetical protein BDQ94DRAFT_140098, partial [Aspergillus welwitschiae]